MLTCVLKSDENWWSLLLIWVHDRALQSSPCYHGGNCFSIILFVVAIVHCPRFIHKLLRLFSVAEGFCHFKTCKEFCPLLTFNAATLHLCAASARCAKIVFPCLKTFCIMESVACSCSCGAARFFNDEAPVSSSSSLSPNRQTYSVISERPIKEGLKQLPISLFASHRK